MSDQQVTVNLNQLLMFLVIGVVAVVGVIGFFLTSSGQKDSSIPVAGTSANTGSQVAGAGINDGFLGDKGSAVEAVEGKVYLDETLVNDGNMHAFNYFSEKDNKVIYFFIVKASDGTFRAAANACEVCFSSKKGFKQVGNLIKCENCGVTYPKDSIALQKGGCNPGPIDKDVVVEEGRLVINVSDLENVAYLF